MRTSIVYPTHSSKKIFNPIFHSPNRSDKTQFTTKLFPLNPPTYSPNPTFQPVTRFLNPTSTFPTISPNLTTPPFTQSPTTSYFFKTNQTKSYPIPLILHHISAKLYIHTFKLPKVQSICNISPINLLTNLPIFIPFFIRPFLLKP